MPKKKIIAANKKTRLPRNDPRRKDALTAEQIGAINCTGSEHDMALLNALPELDKDAAIMMEIQRLQFRGCSVAEISRWIGFSYATTEKFIAKLNKLLRSDVQNIDYPLLIGQGMAFYDQIIVDALAVGEESKSATVKLNSIKIATSVHQAKLEFLDKTKAFDTMPPQFLPVLAEDAEESDGEQFKRFMTVIIAEFEGIEPLNVIKY